MMQLPVRMTLSTKCERCGLRYPRKAPACVHCTGLTDREVALLRARHEHERLGGANLGRLFLYVAALLLAGILTALLT